MARFDLLVVGAGPAGLSAAAAAARHGAKVCVLDQAAAIGGQIWRRDVQHARPAVPEKLMQELLKRPGATILTASQVVGTDGDRRLLVVREGDGGVKAFECEGLILATGARELMLPFPGWTLPGVSGAGGLQALLKGGVAIAGQRVVVAGTGPLLWVCADMVARKGGSVVAIVESLPVHRLAGFAAGLWRHPGKLAQALALRARQLRTSFIASGNLLRAVGDERVKGVELRQGNRLREFACDRIAYGLGLIANVELGVALGCRTIHDGFAGRAIHVDDHQRTSIGGVFAAGECTGSRGAELAAIEGAIAGLAFVNRFDTDGPEARSRRRWRAFSDRVSGTFAVDRNWAREVADQALVCRCEDVPFKAVKAFGSWEEAKMVTRCGMGPCQGRLCGAAVHALLGWGPTRVRRPLTPLSLGALGGLGGRDSE